MRCVQLISNLCIPTVSSSHWSQEFQFNWMLKFGLPARALKPESLFGSSFKVQIFTATDLDYLLLVTICLTTAASTRFIVAANIRAT
ncbi:hypothetical protein NS274_06565 [Pseudomonas oryzihabitans]|nr:hypothetical protein NS274_06565 [Pseudomonas psychrotolerans]KTT29919.1 hypothetical protein NS201_14770 [Pseudomonas psychrotolerans]KTT35335.1 hypothetical protein SB9_09725 [Pseudomonas psychrotolerans]KTT38961.1 hypothetical protein SB5_14525 [Pseudomonas psychrotolerans]KTT44151.1 hypothetical protein RSA46_13395 [Pseudomonas psychrotolerans]